MKNTASLSRAGLVALGAFALSACSAIPSVDGPKRVASASSLGAVPVSAAQTNRSQSAKYAAIRAASATPRQTGKPALYPAAVAAPRQIASSRGSTAICQRKLGQTGTQFEALPDQYFGGGCSNLGTVKMSSIQGDGAVFAIANLGPVECDTAHAFTAWARYGVDRAARQILGSPLAKIETMGSYSCRNVAGSAKRSAHASAAAIDVSAFVLKDGRRISLAGDWDGGSQKERQFLRTVHRSACKRFGTVLGPEYNADHRDHFHMERSGNGFCR
jgi:hypothetical protein